ncbi:trihelix transcription factor PTL [Dorcoceras hygrometricum]|uniref:Trihelix transcription factor PTL n=1 Tax=Dorcoceras hygrometricum TaxID=472368 RepID=A0A2Z7CWA4_9LAMI|nr:trihelix transcription factor PTL [Dorcoceras hygrometricum]
MEDQYGGMADLRQFISDRPFFPPPPPELLPAHRSLSPSQHYEMLMLQREMQHHEFPSDSTNSACVTAAGLSGLETEATGVQIGGGEAAGGGGGGDSCTARWPRQETLTLLEIRSRLDPKFKEANQKGPLWDEVSRIMSDEHGYQRSGKKCREKFENLYKYYKKTRDGKAGRQDGKHYRFFRQLEALYGENSYSASVSETHFNGGSLQYNVPNKNTLSAYNQESYPGALKLSETTSLSLSNSSDSDTDLSDDTGTNVGINREKGHDCDDDTPKKKMRKGKSSWKAKIKDFIDSKMKKLMDKQEAWMEKMLRAIEHKEQERMTREEEWRKQDAARIEREHKFWASERAWMEARDATLMNALQKLAGKECRASPHEDFTGRCENQNDHSSETRSNSAKRGDVWPESEITRLIHLRSGMEVKFRQSGIRDEVLWDEISHKMACFGHDRTGLMCRNKWDSVNNHVMNKKRKENSRICCYNYQNNESICNQTGGAYSDTSEQGIDNPVSLNGHGNSPYNNSDAGNIATSDTCFRYFMGDGYGRILD